MTYDDLDCRISFPVDFPPVYADPDKLEQVLTNLVENAAKYANPVGMTVVGTMGEGEVAVAVSDRGEGIPASDLPKVFKKFFRRDMGKPTGTGLGLYLTNKLVSDVLRGIVFFTSHPGVGSVFTIRVPTDVAGSEAF